MGKSLAPVSLSFFICKMSFLQSILACCEDYGQYSLKCVALPELSWSPRFSVPLVRLCLRKLCRSLFVYPGFPAPTELQSPHDPSFLSYSSRFLKGKLGKHCAWHIKVDQYLRGLHLHYIQLCISVKNYQCIYRIGMVYRLSKCLFILIFGQPNIIIHVSFF